MEGLTKKLRFVVINNSFVYVKVVNNVMFNKVEDIVSLDLLM